MTTDTKLKLMFAAKHTIAVLGVVLGTKLLASNAYDVGRVSTMRQWEVDSKKEGDDLENEDDEEP